MVFIQENAFENAVCSMAAILSLPKCDKHAVFGVLCGIHTNDLWFICMVSAHYTMDK